MFTGLIERLGRVVGSERRGRDRRLRIATGWTGDDLPAIGDSLAVDGVCLTVVERSGDEAGFDVSAETLNCTTLGRLNDGDPVNLERALRPTTRLGGHIVSGHVDGLGRVVVLEPVGESRRLVVEVDEALARYIAAKGALTVDGVSLTVNRVEGARAEINLIPHTRAVTTLGRLAVGREVNIEVDLVARYLERLIGDAGLDAGRVEGRHRDRLGDLW